MGRVSSLVAALVVSIVAALGAGCAATDDDDDDDEPTSVCSGVSREVPSKLIAEQGNEVSCFWNPRTFEYKCVTVMPTQGGTQAVRATVVVRYPSLRAFIAEGNCLGCVSAIAVEAQVSGDLRDVVSRHRYPGTAPRWLFLGELFPGDEGLKTWDLQYDEAGRLTTAGGRSAVQWDELGRPVAFASSVGDDCAGVHDSVTYLQRNPISLIQAQHRYEMFDPSSNPQNPDWPNDYTFCAADFAEYELVAPGWPRLTEVYSGTVSVLETIWVCDDALDGRDP